MSPYNQYSDEQLVTRLTQEDTGAFEEIYYRYVDELYKHARRIIRSKEDCEEILQEVFEYLWKHRLALHIQSLRAYLYKAVANKAVDHLKKTSVHQRYIDHYRLFESIYTQPDYAEPAEVVIERAIQHLPERVKTAVRLRLYECLTNSEVAERMMITTKTVENYMHIVYTHLKSGHPHPSKIDS